MITFHVRCVPPTCTSQQKRCVNVGGKPRFFKSKDQKQSEATYESLLMPYQPKEPMSGPLAVTVCVTYPWRKSEPKKRLALGAVPHTSKPDLDNLVKTLIDCMARLCFIVDDAQISDLHVAKRWGDEPGIYVVIENDGDEEI